MTDVSDFSCDPWPIVWPCDTSTTDPDVVAMAERAAQELLWALGGHRVGVCTYSEGYYPACSSECGPPYKGSDGEWRNRGAAAGSTCCRILLVNRPVVEVVEVVVDGVVMGVGEFGWSPSYLGRVGACWPCGDNCTEPPVWVTYRAGVPFPALTAAAMGEVACEFVRGFEGSPCKLPSRAVSIARQGVTVELASAEDTIAAGRIGLPIADAWLRIVNPTGLRTQSRVYSPDLARRDSMRTTP